MTIHPAQRPPQHAIRAAVTAAERPEAETQPASSRQKECAGRPFVLPALPCLPGTAPRRRAARAPRRGPTPRLPAGPPLGRPSGRRRGVGPSRRRPGERRLGARGAGARRPRRTAARTTRTSRAQRRPELRGGRWRCREARCRPLCRRGLPPRSKARVSNFAAWKNRLFMENLTFPDSSYTFPARAVFESRPWLFPSSSSSQDQEIETIFATQTCAHDVERELAHEKFSENPRERKKKRSKRKKLVSRESRCQPNAQMRGKEVSK